MEYREGKNFFLIPPLSDPVRAQVTRTDDQSHYSASARGQRLDESEGRQLHLCTIGPSRAKEIASATFSYFGTSNSIVLVRLVPVNT